MKSRQGRESEPERLVVFSEVATSLRGRAEGIDEWLKEIGSNCKREQKHCDPGEGVERVYWHYGYAVAIKDVLDLLLSLSKPIN